MMKVHTSETAVLVMFAVTLIGCILAGIPILAALALGYLIFFAYTLSRGYTGVCNKTNQFYQTLNVNKSLSCDVFATTVTTLFLKVYLMKLTCLIMPSMSLNHSVVIYCGYTFI